MSSTIEAYDPQATAANPHNASADTTKVLVRLGRAVEFVPAKKANRKMIIKLAHATASKAPKARHIPAWGGAPCIVDPIESEG